MRISTNMIFDSGVARISDQQAALLKTQQQISANRRMLTPADDPIAAARALDVTQRQSINTQYADNRTQAKNSLNQEEQALDSLVLMIQDLQTQTIEAGDAAYSDTQRGYIATEMRGTLEEMLGLANTRDSNGDYLFSGYQTSTQSFTATASGASYAGDQGQRNMQVDSTRFMSVSDAGSKIFESSPASGTFNVAIGSGTFSSGDVSSLSITSQAALTGHQYQVVFAGGGTTYSVNDVTAGTTLVTGAAYTVPQTISFDGVQLSIKGARTNGDTLTVNTTAPSQNQSLFKTVTDLVNLLEKSTSGVIGTQNLTKGLAAATADLASALDNVLTVRASTGARLKELDSLDSAGEDRDLQYSAMLSQLQDLDTIKAYSDLTLQKTVLEAAQKSFTAVSGLSLFSYI